MIGSHPKGLFYFIIAELWERFSYFGMRALLVIYLVDHWRLNDVRATALYGSVTSLAFGMSIAGGILADRLVGRVMALFLGGFLIILGNAILGFQDMLHPSAGVFNFCLFGLTLIVVGTGFFKPSVSAQIGSLYGSNDPRREGAFYLFYIGINVGGALAPLITGYLALRFGWGWGFAVASLGMAGGLISLLAGRGHLGEGEMSRSTEIAGQGWLGLIAPVVVLVGGTFLLLHYLELVGWVLLLCLIGGLAFLTRFMVREAGLQERQDLQAVLILTCAAAVFWSFFEQGGSLLNLFAERVVDLHAGPILLRAPQTQFFNPLFVILGAPLLVVFWRWLSARGIRVSPPTKFTLGLALAGVGFAVLSLGAFSTGAGAKVSLGWLVAVYFFHTAGELCLATPAYATLTRLAPAPVRTLVMGLWMFAPAVGNFMGSKIAGITTSAAGPNSSLTQYGSAFAVIACGAAVATIAMLAVAAEIKRMIGWDTLKDRWSN